MVEGWLGRIYAIACGLVAVICLWSALHVATLVFAGLGIFFGVTGASVLCGWPVARWLAGVSGAMLVLYGISVIVLGWEDVGGARGAIPLALSTGLAGGLGLIVGVASWLERGEPG